METQYVLEISHPDLVKSEGGETVRTLLTITAIIEVSEPRARVMYALLKKFSHLN